jgi:diguanylate cyclase (GGDEF)-like protein
VDPVTTVALAVAVAVAAATAYLAFSRARRAAGEIDTLRRDLETERYAARHDPLTGLLNRRGFYHHGVAAIADPTRGDQAVLLLDLDNFKQVNDELGHAAGDEVLGVVARRFAACADGDLAARLGGDEFACLISIPGGDAGRLDQITCRLVETIAMPIAVGGHVVTVSGSVGAATVHGQDMDQFTDALRTADHDMYRAKATARDPGPRRLVHPTGHHVARPARAYGR